MTFKLFKTLLLLISGYTLSLAQVPTPESVFGFKVGTDYKLADYDQMLDYYDQLVKSSDRIQMIDIGQSVMGRPIKLMFISSAENLKQLDRYKEISKQLARAKIDPSAAKDLIQEGKAVVWIDAGMHASERACAQMSSELAYKLVTEESDEMKKIRSEVITLLCPVINPDGVDIIVDWYRKQLGTPFETSRTPILYQKYVGHDNNRDWFMNNMPETRAATNILYREWYPQIIHNHHQTSPAWARIFLPPFRSPVNPRIHPGVTTSVNMVGTAMANRFAMKKMPGVISGTNFSMWWNGGMRTAPYYHNMIGILTEVAHATPTPRYYDPKKKPKTVAGIRSDGTEVFYPYPWEGGDSHFRDAVDYMITASMGILDLAADRKEEFLQNIYTMGKDAIENDTEAFAYVLPTDQWDKSEAIKLVEVLQRGGLEATEATADFTANGKSYKAGSIIFYGAQAFRPFLIDLLEKQTYPNQYLYPGGPPKPPYDLAGWTLPLQMGVQVDRIDDAFQVSTQALTDLIKEKARKISGSATAGYTFDTKENAAYTAVNKLVQRGYSVYLQEDGSFFVAAADGLKDIAEELATTDGIAFKGMSKSKIPKGKQKKLTAYKFGIYKSWVANMDEGWTRWVLKEHAFDVDTLYDADIRAGNLEEYAAIILPDQRPKSLLHGHDESRMPKEYTGGIGLEGVVNLSKYVKNGGTLITFDKASDLAIEQFGLPIKNLTNNLANDKFFIPGSLIRAKVDTNHPLARGMQEEVAASFSRSRAFEIAKPSYKGEGGVEKIKKAATPDVDIIVKFAEKDLLLSGWANGEEKYLKNKGAMLNAKYGEGNVVLFSFRPQFRGQSRGTYKLIFNAILQAAATEE